MPPYNTRFNRINWDWLGRKKARKPYIYYDLRAIQECLEQLFGAGRGNRTPMTSQSRDFESRASTNSAIPAKFPACQRGA